MPTVEPILLDTHVWLDVAWGREKSVSARVRRKLDRAADAGSLYVAAITPWEVAALAKRGRIRVSGPLIDFITETLRETKTAVFPLEPEIAVDAVELPGWEHGDPADRLIVATARALRGVLVTRDSAIIAYGESAKAVRVLEPR